MNAKDKLKDFIRRRYIILILAGWLLTVLIAVALVGSGFTHIRMGKDMLEPVFNGNAITSPEGSRL
ncbi:MAG: hypothetical protein KC777_25845 [Cyanobacteria bacterium HKST-UBA02]|nr:hypothetical protein [Cyanobacteria bacterium HKST-UBA02]